MRDGEAERLGGVEIDDQLECGRLLHREVSGVGAFEDLSDVNADLVPRTAAARPIAD